MMVRKYKKCIFLRAIETSKRTFGEFNSEEFANNCCTCLEREDV
jgi:hypothetical protein